jgi:hypothetical protein
MFKMDSFKDSPILSRNNSSLNSNLKFKRDSKKKKSIFAKKSF